MASRLSHFTHKTSFFTSNPRRPSAPCMSAVVSAARTQSYWASIDAEIDAYLKKSIPIRSPESVFEPMHHLTFAAPRTTAAALCVAACELVGGDRDQAMAAAAAIHLMHAAAYTHEHLPLTDRPRPRPGIQHKYNPNIELLTGDGIIPFGLELLARSVGPARSNPDKILRVIIEITRATGSQGMVDGQYQELGLDRLGSEYDVIEYVCKKKEGELHACGAACGAILGGGAEDEIESLRRFGLYAGTVQGIQGKNKAGFMEEKIEKLKELAVKELESLQGKKTELISSLVEPSLVAVHIS
ncbi:Heterodimeric geranylgeranyl pyrophosphate synthase large subunit, chloroplastic [Sesamum angolense]|uniref:Heterodimeric geranylgeranyl pyrophosphate synthase large subunit, chloroplastic n=1 Tax=Sesamum angolense TaxID=2727404 RepID=A0AAE1WSH3_9LAMI|nr:Heterodimeric geranylgeranyl pyrophosphate synthase large subunit, chloroplastic [Sesamum angolense]